LNQFKEEDSKFRNEGSEGIYIDEHSEGDPLGGVYESVSIDDNVQRTKNYDLDEREKGLDRHNRERERELESRRVRRSRSS
jgi:hypothetical protein